jgi:hypothetical protein
MTIDTNEEDENSAMMTTSNNFHLGGPFSELQE